MNRSQAYHLVTMRYMAALFWSTLLTGMTMAVDWYIIKAPLLIYAMLAILYCWCVFVYIYRIIEYRGYERIAKLEEIWKKRYEYTNILKDLEVY